MKENSKFTVTFMIVIIFVSVFTISYLIDNNKGSNITGDYFVERVGKNILAQSSFSSSGSSGSSSSSGRWCIDDFDFYRANNGQSYYVHYGIKYGISQPGTYLQNSCVGLTGYLTYLCGNYTSDRTIVQNAGSCNPGYRCEGPGVCLQHCANPPAKPADVGCMPGTQTFKDYEFNLQTCDWDPIYTHCDLANCADAPQQPTAQCVDIDGEISIYDNHKAEWNWNSALCKWEASIIEFCSVDCGVRIPKPECNRYRCDSSHDSDRCYQLINYHVNYQTCSWSFIENAFCAPGRNCRIEGQGRDARAVCY